MIQLERELAQSILEKLQETEDAGPAGERWQSEDLQDMVLQLQAAIDAPPPQVLPITASVAHIILGALTVSDSEGISGIDRAIHVDPAEWDKLQNAIKAAQPEVAANYAFLFRT